MPIDQLTKQNLLVEKIEKILEPTFGRELAESMVRVNCERIGVTPATFSIQKTPEFAEKLKVSLFLFLEEKEIQEITEKIEKLR